MVVVVVVRRRLMSRSPRVTAPTGWVPVWSTRSDPDVAGRDSAGGWSANTAAGSDNPASASTRSACRRDTASSVPTTLSESNPSAIDSSVSAGDQTGDLGKEAHGAAVGRLNDTATHARGSSIACRGRRIWRQGWWSGAPVRTETTTSWIALVTAAAWSGLSTREAWVAPGTTRWRLLVDSVAILS
jgi:hypothetical protein